MLGSLKKLFFKDTGEDLATSIPEPVAIAPGAEWPAISGNPEPAASTSGTPEAFAFSANQTTPPDLLSLPLAAIFARLPNSLASVVQSQGNGFVSLPASKIVQELPKGSVKIPFGELRQATAPGTFFDNARHDHVLVELPLSEILARLNPSLLSRRPDQKQIQVPAEITDIFGPHGEGISLGTAPISTPRTTSPKPAASGDTSIAKKGDTSMFPRGDTSFRTRTMPAVAPAHIFTTPTAVVQPLQEVPAEPEVNEQGEPVLVPLRLLCEGWPELIRLEIQELNLLNAPVAFPLDKLGEALRVGKIIFTWKQICAWMRPVVNHPSGTQDLELELPLKIITPLFMAKHRRTKVQKTLSIADIPDLFAKRPSEEVPAELASQPAAAVIAPVVAPAAPAITHVAPTITPLAPKFATVAPKITPVAPTIAPAASIVEQPRLAMKVDNIAPLPAPIEIKPEIAPEIKPVVTKPNTIGEIFNQPARKDWPPAEVLKHLVTLPGIAGGFLAMQDGLLVAAELPAQFKAETVAAFLPQIFGRMNQYAKELQMGGLSSLSFVVENVSWQIIKSGAIYLVALGKSGENLPSAQLNIIATELGKQMQ